MYVLKLAFSEVTCAGGFALSPPALTFLQPGLPEKWARATAASHMLKAEGKDHIKQCLTEQLVPGKKLT